MKPILCWPPHYTYVAYHLPAVLVNKWATLSNTHPHEVSAQSWALVWRVTVNILCGTMLPGMLVGNTRCAIACDAVLSTMVLKSKVLPLTPERFSCGQAHPTRRCISCARYLSWVACFFEKRKGVMRPEAGAFVCIWPFRTRHRTS